MTEQKKTHTKKQFIIKQNILIYKYTFNIYITFIKPHTYKTVQIKVLNIKY